MRLEEGLIGCQHTVKPGKELLGTVVGVQEDWDAIGSRHGAHVVRPCNGSKDRVLQHSLLIRQCLAAEKRRSALRELDHDRTVQLPAGL
eukprot:CAMPEP_0170623662 /NCGR_PEP_ID=MMETSP0224-20130122/29819_1 /TAXON_ID=285029 /ORGANISM="Togula jolla, Strain CCCM 725" /LENGTH=88 /DNA_ID=CAMNT_0010950133 /DNA_START=72 /DNA_END=338 /DNA_ORIENTATION=+